MKDEDGSMMWIVRGLLYGLVFIPLALTFIILYPFYLLVRWGLPNEEQELFW